MKNSWQKCLLPVMAVMLFLVLAPIAKANEVLSDPEPLPPFSLTDQYGKQFTKDDLKGKWSMIFVGFASCPDVCPFTLANLEAVRADMGFRMRPDTIPNIVFLSVDPERDMPNLKEYLYYYHPEYIGITGVRAQIDVLIKGIDAFYRLDKKTPDDRDYQVVHSAKVAIINPNGELVAQIEPPFKPHQTGEFLINLIRDSNS